MTRRPTPPRPHLLSSVPLLLGLTLGACGGPLDESDPTASASGEEAELESSSDAVSAAACRATPAPTMCAAPNTSLLSSCTLAANTPFTLTRSQSGQTVTQSVTCAAGRALTQRCATTGNVLNACTTAANVAVQVTPSLALTCGANTGVVFDSQGFATVCAPTTATNLRARSYQDQSSIWRPVAVTCAAGAAVSFWSGPTVSGLVRGCRLAANTTYTLPSVRWQEPIPCAGGQAINFADQTVGYLSACRLSQAWRAQDTSSLIRTCPANADVAFRSVQAGLKSNGQPYYVLEPTTVNGQPWTQACPAKAALFSTPGTHTFVLPQDTSGLRAVLVGGGGGGGYSSVGVRRDGGWVPFAGNWPPNADFGGAGSGGSSGNVAFWTETNRWWAGGTVFALTVGAGGPGCVRTQEVETSALGAECFYGGVSGGETYLRLGNHEFSRAMGSGIGMMGTIYSRGGQYADWWTMAASGGGAGGNPRCNLAATPGGQWSSAPSSAPLPNGRCDFPGMDPLFVGGAGNNGGRGTPEPLNPPGFTGLPSSAFRARPQAGTGGAVSGSGGGGGGGGLVLTGLPAPVAGAGQRQERDAAQVPVYFPHAGAPGQGGVGFGAGGGGGSGFFGAGGNGADGAVYLEWD